MLGKEIKSLFKHSSIYGIGTIAGQAVGFLLLPLYTRYLTPADYGIATIIDITMALFGVTVGVGILNAMTRFYYEDEDEASRRRVVSTMYWMIFIISCIALFGILSLSTFLSQQLFADSRYTTFFNIAAISLAFGFLVDTAMLYLMIRARSLLYVTVSLSNLILLIVFNIFFVVVMESGLIGIFYSMVITRVILAIVVALPIFVGVGFGFSRRLAVSMLWFSFPMIFSSLFRLGANESDKYFINYFFSPVETGIYAIASKIGNAVHLLITGPFLQSYNPKKFQIMKQADAQEIYAHILNYYLLIIVTAGFMVSIFSSEIIRLMTTDQYHEAANYIPLLIVSWIIFGARYHFETGILIAKKTRYFAYINGGTAILSIALNYLLIGHYKIWGALIALNISQLVTTGLFYVISRRLYPIRYHFNYITKLVVFSLLCYAGASLVEHDNLAISFTLKMMVLMVYLLLLRLSGLFDDALVASLKQAFTRISSMIIPCITQLK
jgi:O-antigen/teichoic acid export membrane protein